MPEILLIVDAAVSDQLQHGNDQAESTSQLSFTVEAVDQVRTTLVETVTNHAAAAWSGVDRLPVSVRVIPATSLTEQALELGRTQPSKVPDRDHPLYPLTLDLPKFLQFPGQTIYQACREISKLRQRVQQLGYATGTGCFWLPIVLTAKGPLYAEVIGLINQDSQRLTQEVSQLSQLQYCQPIHISDQWRQLLYQLGYRLLQLLSAPPATYLMQFGFQAQGICFDRLWPFPAKPAIASIGVQKPDLFACHWYCLTGLPVLDLIIPGSAFYQTYQ